MEHRAITCAASKTMHTWWQRMFTCEFVGASTCPRVFFCNGWMCTFCNNETGSHFAHPGCVYVCECVGGCAQQHMGVESCTEKANQAFFFERERWCCRMKTVWWSECVRVRVCVRESVWPNPDPRTSTPAFCSLIMLTTHSGRITQNSIWKARSIHLASLRQKTFSVSGTIPQPICSLSVRWRRKQGSGRNVEHLSLHQ